MSLKIKNLWYIQKQLSTYDIYSKLLSLPFSRPHLFHS
jgi:hypothetical protein